MTPESSSQPSQHSEQSEPVRSPDDQQAHPTCVTRSSPTASSNSGSQTENPSSNDEESAQPANFEPLLNSPTFAPVIEPLPSELESFFFDRLNFERQSTTAYSERNYRLHPIQDLLRRLDNPHRLPVIHIAGTKGKGSVATLIQQALVEAGYKVGLYTSPHVSCLTERFVVNRSAISFAELAAAVEKLKPVVQAMDAEADADPKLGRLTFFDVCTAAAFVAFRQQEVDCAVIEVGLGGRLDSTNVVEPLVSIVTSISYDHTAQLGNTLEQIATEKAGIIKPNIPVVSGVTDPAAQSVILNTANSNQCENFQLNRDMNWCPQDDGYSPDDSAESDDANRCDSSKFDVRFSQHPDWDLTGIEMAMIGDHQRDNCVLAVAAMRILQRNNWQVNDAAIARAFRSTIVQGRIQVVGHQPLTVLDAAHNPASFRALIQTLCSTYQPVQRSAKKRLVFAASKDKDYQTLLALAADYFDEVLFCKYAGNPRGVTTDELVKIWNQVTAELRPNDQQIFDSPKDAFVRGKSISAREDLLVVAGSVFLLGEL